MPLEGNKNTDFFFEKERQMRGGGGGVGKRVSENAETERRREHGSASVKFVRTM